MDEPVQNNILNQCSFNEKEISAIDADIQKLLDKRVIVESEFGMNNLFLPYS